MAWRGNFILRLSRGLVAVSVHASTSPGVGPHVVAEPKFLLSVVVLSEPLLGEDCHGQADQRVAAAALHGGVHRKRHICRNPAPLSRRGETWSALELRFVGIAFAILAPVHFRAEKRAWVSCSSLCNS